MSKGLFAESVTVSGLEWCKDSPKTVGIGSLTSKILCQKHNNDLSPFDAEAIRLYDALNSISATKEAIKARPHLNPGNRKHNISGVKFEKWAIKTYLNILHCRSLPHLSPNIDSLLDVLYGSGRLQSPFGIYFYAIVGGSIHHTPSFSFFPLFDEQETLGCLFTFCGFPFMLQFPSACGKPFAQDISFPSDIVEMRGMIPTRHVPYIRYKGHQFAETIKFFWD